MRFRSLCLVALGFAHLGLAEAGETTRSARLDAWRVLGPGGGGTTRRPVISPHDPQVVLLACDMTGAYLTRNGGASWRMFNLGWVPSAFAFDPVRASTMYAGSNALYRSDDEGRTWQMVFPDPARGAVVRARGDHAEPLMTADDPAYPSGRYASIHAVAVDPTDSHRVYVALRAAGSPIPGTPAEPTRLVGSTDGARSFVSLTAFAQERIFAIWPEPGGNVVRVFGETGTYEGAGTTWRHHPAPDGVRFESGSFGRDPATGRTRLYATSPLEATPDGPRGGIVLSENGGRTWSEVNGGLLGSVRNLGKGESWGPPEGSRPTLGPVATSAASALVAYVGLRGIHLPGRGEKPFNGIARTADAGQSWSVVHAESDHPSSNLEGSWIEERATEDVHSVWFDAPYDIAVAPGNGDIVYASDLFRVYRTRDDGRTWSPSNSGVAESALTHLLLDPRSPKGRRTLYAAALGRGVYKSSDGGRTWGLKNTGLRPDPRNQPFAWRLTLSPDGALYRSLDGAESWTPIPLPAGTNGPNGLTVDPEDPKRLYLSAWGVVGPEGDTGGGIFLSLERSTSTT